jgi:hypothetical protein
MKGQKVFRTMKGTITRLGETEAGDTRDAVRAIRRADEQG